MSGLRASARVEGSRDRWKRTYLHAHEHGCWCTQVLRAAGRDPVPHWRSSGGHVSLSPGPLTTRQLAALRSRKQGSGRDRDAGQRLCTIKSQKWHPLTFPRSGSSLGSPIPRAAGSTEGWPPGGRGPGGQLGGHPYAAEYHTTSKQKRISCPAVSGSGTPWTTALQAPLSMESGAQTPRQEYWSEWPFPPPGDLFDPGIELRSLALQEDYLPFEPPGMPNTQKS